MGGGCAYGGGMKRAEKTEGWRGSREGWLEAAYAALDAGAPDRDFYEAKIATGRYYMARQLPACAMHLARIESGAEPVMALKAEAF